MGYSYITRKGGGGGDVNYSSFVVQDAAGTKYVPYVTSESYNLPNLSQPDNNNFSISSDTSLTTVNISNSAASNGYVYIADNSSIVRKLTPELIEIASSQPVFTDTNNFRREGNVLSDGNFIYFIGNNFRVSNYNAIYLYKVNAQTLNVESNAKQPNGVYTTGKMVLYGNDLYQYVFDSNSGAASQKIQRINTSNLSNRTNVTSTLGGWTIYDWEITHNRVWLIGNNAATSGSLELRQLEYDGGYYGGYPIQNSTSARLKVHNNAIFVFANSNLFKMEANLSFYRQYYNSNRIVGRATNSTFIGNYLYTTGETFNTTLSKFGIGNDITFLSSENVVGFNGGPTRVYATSPDDLYLHRASVNTNILNAFQLKKVSPSGFTYTNQNLFIFDRWEVNNNATGKILFNNVVIEKTNDYKFNASAPVSLQLIEVFNNLQFIGHKNEKTFFIDGLAKNIVVYSNSVFLQNIAVNTSGQTGRSWEVGPNNNSLVSLSYNGYFIDIVNTVTLVRGQGSWSSSSSGRAVAIAPNGAVYTSTTNGSLFLFSESGSQLASFPGWGQQWAYPTTDSTLAAYYFTSNILWKTRNNATVSNSGNISSVNSMLSGNMALRSLIDNNFGYSVGGGIAKINLAGSSPVLSAFISTPYFLDTLTIDSSNQILYATLQSNGAIRKFHASNLVVIEDLPFVTGAGTIGRIVPSNNSLYLTTKNITSDTTASFGFKETDVKVPEDRLYEVTYLKEV